MSSEFGVWSLKFLVVLCFGDKIRALTVYKMKKCLRLRSNSYEIKKNNATNVLYGHMVCAQCLLWQKKSQPLAEKKPGEINCDEMEINLLTYVNIIANNVTKSK